MMVQTSQSAAGFLKWQVIDGKTGKVVRDSGPDWIRNLILNNGLNGINTRTWVDSFTYAMCGTGVTPTSVDSLTTNGTLSSGVVTTDAAFFAAGDVGAELKWDDGTRALITSYLNSTTVNVANVTGSATGHFIKYETQQTGLSAEVKRTNTYLTGTGNCGSSWVGNQHQARRTYDFSIEVASQNYTEVGFGWAASGANTTFARILLPSAVFVDVGQQLRVVYELRVSLNPGSPISRSAAISGWTGTSGVEQIQAAYLVNLTTGGLSTGFSSCEPSNFGGSGWGIFLSPSSAAPAAFGSAVSRTSNAGYCDSYSRAAYTTNSFLIDATGTFNVGTANRSDFRSMGFGAHNPNLWFSAGNTAYVFVFDNPQTKDNSHTLTLTFRASWSRDLA